MNSYFNDQQAGASGAAYGMETTGDYLVLLADEATDTGVSALESTAGVKIETVATTDEEGIGAVQLEEAGNIVFESLGVAVVKAEPDQVGPLALSVQQHDAVLAVEPERVVYATREPALEAELEVVSQQAAPLSPEYLRGYRDALDSLLTRSLQAAPGLAAPAVDAEVQEATATWGLRLTRAARSRFTGRGIRVAVLDTGMDLAHPDFTGRAISRSSFVVGEEVQDGHGHGTHCIGTACGPARPSRLPRYGVACDAEIFAGKVLSNRGRGTDRGILAGIAWAVGNRCRVVSMSLGAPTTPGTRYSDVFEIAARRAMRAGTLIVAAAGNDSQRQLGIVRPVSHPANCPAIMAVAAVDETLAVASFSNRGLNPDGGQVDIAGPGVRVHSSWPRPSAYNTISGTSMATPHVAGIAALHAEANPEITPVELGAFIARTARRLLLPSADVGAGLVQAP